MVVQTSVSLELPGTRTRSAEFVVIQADGSSPPVKHALDVPKEGSVGDIYALLAKVFQLALFDGALHHFRSLVVQLKCSGISLAGCDKSIGQ